MPGRLCGTVLIGDREGLDDLVRRFDEATLPEAEWTHHAHLVVGLRYVERYGAEEALHRLRSGIRRLNDSHGTVNSATSGYHETITRVYVHLLAAFAERHAHLSTMQRIEVLSKGPLAEKQILFVYYSRERLFSPEARLGWLEPDLAPLGSDTVLPRKSSNLRETLDA